MREPRNPFRMRASEQIESEETFLRLFGPGVLDLLPSDNLWHRVQIFQSAPGGGKTSLFRVFTPGALCVLHESRANDEYKELYSRLKALGAISDRGPSLLGVMISCARNYAMLEDLTLDVARRERLLYSLLNARLVLSALRGALRLKNLDYPKDLDRLTINIPREGDLAHQLPLPASGKALYQWALSLEKSVCETIDSFDPSCQDGLEGHDTLYSLSILRPDCILCDGVPIAASVLVMLDDVHKMTIIQRQKLLESLFDLRPAVGVWIAERLEALSTEELLSSGATTGREYGRAINLEEFWRLPANNKRFETALISISDRRAKSTRDVPLGSFSGCLQDSLDGVEWQSKFDIAVNLISERVHKLANTTPRYQEWLKERKSLQGTPRDFATAWRSLEILIERDLRKAQTSFDFVLETAELEKREASAVRAAAEYFVSREFGLPHYFGITRLASLSSSNIEQFLAFAGELFEEIISAVLLKRPSFLTPERQQVIVKRVAQQRWEEIPRRIPNGRDVQRLLGAIRDFALWETNKPNAPYAPGVTGIAISMRDRDNLINQEVRSRHPEYERIAQVLSACISHNLLEASLDRSQGQIGKTWMILYLNRWLCLHFGLPLHYGGWRPKNLEDISVWLEHGFRTPIRNGEMFV